MLNIECEYGRKYRICNLLRRQIGQTDPSVSSDIYELFSKRWCGIVIACGGLWARLSSLIPGDHFEINDTRRFVRPATSPLTTLSAGESTRWRGLIAINYDRALDRKTVGRDGRFVCGIVVHHRGIGPDSGGRIAISIGIAIIASENGY